MAPRLCITDAKIGAFFDFATQLVLFSAIQRLKIPLYPFSPFKLEDKFSLSNR
jgi:hypothetical protein